MRKRVRSILVVVDDDVVAAGVTEALVRSGYEVERRRHGPEVSARVSGAEEGLPDLLVVGVGAPGDGGMEGLRGVLGGLDGRRSAVVLTAGTTPEHEEELRGLGACAVLPMGTPSEEILAAVRGALRRE